MMLVFFRMLLFLVEVFIESFVGIVSFTCEENMIKKKNRKRQILFSPDTRKYQKIFSLGDKVTRGGERFFKIFLYYPKSSNR